MPQYGDAILKAMTLDALSELFGKESYQVTSNIFPLAISNAFYEQIVLHYGLDLLSPTVQSDRKAVTHLRGDLLEAYMAAIEKDVSRDGKGYREVRDWLFQILALRLRRVRVHNDWELYSSGTEHKSLTILPVPEDASLPPVFETQSTYGSKFLQLEAPQVGNKDIMSAAQAADLWHQRQHAPALHSTTKANISIMDSAPSNETTNLNHFRRFLFETMRQTVAQSSKLGSLDLKCFWTALSCLLSQLQDSLEDESESLLLYYYRVCYYASFF